MSALYLIVKSDGIAPLRPELFVAPLRTTQVSSASARTIAGVVVNLVPRLIARPSTICRSSAAPRAAYDQTGSPNAEDTACGRGYRSSVHDEPCSRRWNAH